MPKAPATDAPLYYTGDADGLPYILGVPARDLGAADLARLAFIRGITPAAVRDELIASGIYTPEPPAPSED